jgi:hypothetical protein
MYVCEVALGLMKTHTHHSLSTTPSTILLLVFLSSALHRDYDFALALQPVVLAGAMYGMRSDDPNHSHEMGSLASMGYAYYAGNDRMFGFVWLRGVLPLNH